jgi:magnesium transporter
VTRRRPRRGIHVRRRGVLGAAPGTLAADPNALPPEIRVIAYGPDTFVEKHPASLEDVQSLMGQHPITWVDVAGIGDLNTIEQLGRMFHLHPLALEDVLNVPQRPKAEQYGQSLFLVLHMPTLGEHLALEQMSLFLGKDFVVTFQERPGDCLDNVRERLRKGRERIRGSGPDYLTHAVIDAIVDSYFPILETIGERLEALETAILARPMQRHVTRLHGLKRDLLGFRRDVWPLREVLNTLVRGETPLIAAENRVYFSDCYDHAVQTIDLVESYRDISSGLMDLYLSSMSNRMNEVMKVLTIIATIFIPLSFIAGLYGMNFDTKRSPWNLPELNWYLGYPYALAIMAAIAVVMLIYFRRKEWIGAGRPSEKENQEDDDGGGERTPPPRQ